jgi:hypothetical protein
MGEEGKSTKEEEMTSKTGRRRTNTKEPPKQGSRKEKQEGGHWHDNKYGEDLDRKKGKGQSEKRNGKKGRKSIFQF